MIENLHHLTVAAEAPWLPIRKAHKTGQLEKPGIKRTRAAGGRLLGYLTFLVCWPISSGFHRISAQDVAVEYTDEIIAKAEAKLVANGLRRVGTQIQPVLQEDFAKLLSAEGKATRQLKQLKSTHEEKQRLVLAAESQLEMLESQLQQWNAQYAVEGNTGGRNNALVARINAGTLQQKHLTRQRDLCVDAATTSRAELIAAEESYAELVLKLRELVNTMDATLHTAADVPDVQIAFQVLATRYPVPRELDLNEILTPLDRRVRKFEEAIFKESISLEFERGALFVRATIGLEPISMIVDSGASLVVLPADMGEKLRIQPDANAKTLRMVTADGRRIDAKEVILPRLRVGQFVAENVSAALLSESIPGARPLLGLSFLERFRFQIDPTQKQLTLLRIEETIKPKS